MKPAQLAVIDGTALAEKDFLSAVDKVIVELHQTGDIAKATHVLEIFNKIEDVSGHAKAKLLFGIAGWWQETGQTEKRQIEFVDYIEGAGVLKKTSIDRYMVVEKFIEDYSIPKEFHSRPMRELIPIAKALEQGYDIPKKVWNELKVASDQNNVGRIIREQVKQKPARKNTMRFVLDRDGTLYAYQNNKRMYIAYLAITDEDELVQKAINRILDKIGAKRK